MRYIIESHEDLMKLVHLYCEDKITTDEYFAAIEVWASEQVEREVARGHR